MKKIKMLPKNPLLRRLVLAREGIAYRWDNWDELEKKRFFLWSGIFGSIAAPIGFLTFHEYPIARNALPLTGLAATGVASRVYAGRKSMKNARTWSDLGYYHLEKIRADEFISYLTRWHMDFMADGAVAMAQNGGLLTSLPVFPMEEMTTDPKAIDKYPFTLWLGAQGSGKTTAAGNFLAKCRGVKIAVTHHFKLSQFEAASYRIIPHTDAEVEKIIQQAEQNSKASGATGEAALDITDVQVDPEVAERIADLQNRFIYDEKADPKMSWGEFLSQTDQCPLNSTDVPRYSKYISSSLIQCLFSLRNEVKRRQTLVNQAEAMGKEVRLEPIELVIDEALTLYAFLEQAGKKNREQSRKKGSSLENAPYEIINPDKFWEELMLSASTEWRKYKVRLSVIAHSKTLSLLGMEGLGRLRDTFAQIEMLDMGQDELDTLVPRKERSSDPLYQEFAELVQKRNTWKHPIPVMLSGMPYKLPPGELLHREVQTSVHDWMAKILEELRFQGRMAKEDPESYPSWSGKAEALEEASQTVKTNKPVLKPVSKPILKPSQNEQEEDKYTPTPEEINEYLPKVKALNSDPSLGTNIKIYAHLLNLASKGREYTRTSSILKECFERTGGIDEIQVKKEALHNYLMENAPRQIPDDKVKELLRRFDNAREQGTYPSLYEYSKAMGFPVLKDDPIMGIADLTEPSKHYAIAKLVYAALKMRKCNWRTLYREWRENKED